MPSNSSVCPFPGKTDKKTKDFMIFLLLGEVIAVLSVFIDFWGAFSSFIHIGREFDKNSKLYSSYESAVSSMFLTLHACL